MQQLRGEGGIKAWKHATVNSKLPHNGQIKSLRIPISWSSSFGVDIFLVHLPHIYKYEICKIYYWRTCVPGEGCATQLLRTCLPSGVCKTRLMCNVSRRHMEDIRRLSRSWSIRCEEISRLPNQNTIDKTIPRGWESTNNIEKRKCRGGKKSKKKSEKNTSKNKNSKKEARQKIC